MTCAHPGCGRKLAARNNTGTCFLHRTRKLYTEKQRDDYAREFAAAQLEDLKRYRMSVAELGLEWKYVSVPDIELAIARLKEAE